MVVFMRLNVNDYSQGEVMKIIRQWTGLTQKSFAQEVGKSKRTIEQYEAGAINYNIRFLKDISKKFNLEIVITKKK